jgi:hypothetical protein
MPGHLNYLPTWCLKVDERMIFCRSHQALSTPIDGEDVSVCHEVKARALTSICRRLLRYQLYLLTACSENVAIRSITTRKDIIRHRFFLLFSFFLLKLPKELEFLLLAYRTIIYTIRQASGIRLLNNTFFFHGV